MVTLNSVRDWIQSLDLIETDKFHIGKINENEEKSIGVYQRGGEKPLRISLGGWHNTLYKEKEISVLIHWNKNSKETDEVAIKFYEGLINSPIESIDGHEVYFFRLDTDEPVDVGTDNNGIYERVIWLTIIYNNNKS